MHMHARTRTHKHTHMHATRAHAHAQVEIADHLIPTLKKKKGKEKDNQILPALDRIMGYTGSDMSEEEVRPRSLFLLATSTL